MKELVIPSICIGWLHVPAVDKCENLMRRFKELTLMRFELHNLWRCCLSPFVQISQNLPKGL